jgi:hypothetical protein
MSWDLKLNEKFIYGRFVRDTPPIASPDPAFSVNHHQIPFKTTSIAPSNHASLQTSYADRNSRCYTALSL